MKYLVIRNCCGFRNRYWEAGEIVEIDPSENPPEHFQKMEISADSVESKKPKVKK